jgi:pimeloyl-ACP methyl ester carboxylesterase
MKLFSRIEGEGRPLIILHGLFGMSDNWLTHAKKYAELGFEVHVLDQRNHGQSPQSDDFSYQLMADDLLEYMDDHNIEEARILGHSMGGKVAMLFACQHPKKVERLIVVDIAPKAYPIHHQQYIDALKGIDFSSLQSRGAADEALKKEISNFAIRQFLLKSLYWKEKGQLALRFNLEAIEANLDMVGEALLDDAEYLGETLFINGGQSNYITPNDEELIHHHFPLAHNYTIKQAGHWVHAEAAEEFSEVTTQFLMGMYIG